MLVNVKCCELAYINAVLPGNTICKIRCSSTYTFQQNAVRSHNSRIITFLCRNEIGHDWLMSEAWECIPKIHHLNSVSCWTITYLPSVNLIFWSCKCQLVNVRSLSFSSVLDSPSRLDEEHRLIARYAARLAAEAGNVVSNWICFLASELLSSFLW